MPCTNSAPRPIWLNNPEIGNMPYDSEKHHRRSIRLKGYDYTRSGAYFITIVTQNRACLFGAVVEGRMRLNPLGQIVQECWLAIPDHFPHALLDEFVIMPNHLHGIIVLQEMENSVGARHVPRRRREEFGKPVPGSIPTIVRSFKSAATKHINEYRGTPGAPVWQRNYYEHIIRNDRSLHRIREYIATNPLRWHLDRNIHPTGTDPMDAEWFG
jgi:putative transposase